MSRDTDMEMDQLHGPFPDVYLSNSTSQPDLSLIRPSSTSPNTPIASWSHSSHTRTLPLSKPTSPPSFSRPPRWLSISIFLLLELGFVSLAAFCASRPLVLPSSLAHNEVKGGFTILFIAWQTLALFPVRSIINQVFCSEWFYLFNETGTLVPGETDKVSTLIAGQLDRLRHAYSRMGSWSFRTSFLISLIFVALAAFAPGAINVVTILVPQPMTLNIGNLTITGGDVFEFHYPTWNTIQRAGIITQLEQVESSQFGYRNQNNWMVAWPPLGLPINGSGAIEYPSDVVEFGFSCQWEAPAYDGSVYMTKNGNWSVWNFLGAAQPDFVAACEIPCAPFAGTLTH